MNDIRTFKPVLSLEVYLKLNGLSQYVYRYRKNNKFLKELIISNSLYFSDVNGFTDPTDAQLRFNPKSINEEQLRAIFNKSEIKFSNEQIEDAIKFAIENPEVWVKHNNESLKRLNHFAYCCFTTQLKNLTIWDTYTEHKGVALKFDMLKDKEFFTFNFKMEYSESAPYVNFTKGLTFLDCMRTKNSKYSYENELRVMRFNGKGNYEFKKESLVEIVFGYKMNSKEMKKIIKWCLKYNYPHVEFKRVCDIDGYDIKLEKAIISN